MISYRRHQLNNWLRIHLTNSLLAIDVIGRDFIDDVLHTRVIHRRATSFSRLEKKKKEDVSKNWNVCVDIVVSEIRCWQVSWLLLFDSFCFFLASSYFLGIPSHAAAAAATAEIQNGKYQNKREKQTSFRLVLYLFGGCQFYTPPESLSLFSFHISFIDNELLLPPRETTYSLYSSYSVARRAPGVGCCWLNWSVVRLNYHGNRGERCRREPFFFTGIIFFLFFSDLFSLFLSHTLIDLYFVVF